MKSSTYLLFCRHPTMSSHFLVVSTVFEFETVSIPMDLLHPHHNCISIWIRSFCVRKRNRDGQHCVRTKHARTSRAARVNCFYKKPHFHWKSKIFRDYRTEVTKLTVERGYSNNFSTFRRLRDLKTRLLQVVQPCFVRRSSNIFIDVSRPLITTGLYF